MTEKPKSNHNLKKQFLLLMSSELPAPAGCLSWADIAVQSHSEKGVLLVRERLEQEKMHNPEQG